MQPRLLVSAVAAAALFAGMALAQDAAPPAPQGGRTMMMRHFDKADMQKHFAQMCVNRYAKAVGRMAYLETRLELTAKQKPLFDRWKDVMLSSAKARSDKCADFKFPDHRPTLVEGLKLREKMLQNRLADLKAQMPALEALEASLTPAQQHIMQHAAMQMRHHGMAMMGRMHGGWHDGGMMGGARVIRTHGMNGGMGRGMVGGPTGATNGDALPPPPAQ